MQVRFYNSSDKEPWDDYVLNHPDATHCHLSGWKRAIENAYGHKAYYLLATRSSHPSNSTSPSNSINPSDPTNPINSSNPNNPINSINQIVGILPLFHIKSFIFGNQLTSMPFLNYGGILADNEEAEIALLGKAIELSQKLKVNDMELRHIRPISSLNSMNSSNPMNSSNSNNPSNPSNPIDPINYMTKTHKVRMLLTLPPSKDTLLKSFKSKLRSQISRSQREGMTAIIGGVELIDQFYRVFSVNMRDLGSPVHSKRFFRAIFQEFPENAKIGIVKYQGRGVASGTILSFRNTVEIPWASSLKKYNGFSPNMLLYWSLMEYACDRGFEYFDFGRSTPEEGTYKFKEQWGANPSPLYWHNIISDGHPVSENDSRKSKFETLIRYWKKLPVPVSNIVGPLIRKHISL